MQALYYDGAGELEWREDPEPVVETPSDAIVRPLAVATCDLDQEIIHRSVPGSEEPFAIGHEGAGEVIEVGDAVTSLRPGDLVSIPYHLSCGQCDRCTKELPLFCRQTAAEALAVFGFPVGPDNGGFFSDLIRVPFADHSLLRLPPSVSTLDAVSVGDNLADAWRMVAPHLAEAPGTDVLILGSASIGLFAVDIARACGAGRVRYVDADEQRLELATDFGAEASSRSDFSPEAEEFGLTVNATNDTSGESLRTALLATAPGGRCESSVFHFDDPALPLFMMHLKCLTMRSALSNARSVMPDVLELLSSERISPRRVVTDVLPFEAAAEELPKAGFKPVFVREPEGSHR
jgi:threonine dehydrogenase-like Zn-dependent dehydrogenase